MSGNQIVVGFFAILSATVSAAAVWRVATAPGVKYKPFWIAGSLFGFVGFATSLSGPADLYLTVGIQIPVLRMWTSENGQLILKTLFPVIAAVALVKFHSPGSRPNG